MIWWLSAAALAALAVGLEVRRCSLRVRLRTRQLRLTDCPALPESGLRLLHVSDLHISRRTLWRLEALRRAAQQDWDLVLVSGDFAEEPEGIEPVAQALGALPARYGVWAVLGNHDYFHYLADTPRHWLQVLLGSLRHGRCDSLSLEFPVEELAGALERHGVRLLRNEVATLELENRARLQLFGLDDPVTGRDNPRRLAESVDPRALRLALTHAPTRLQLLRPLGLHLVLCGHTHGGQLRLPGLWAVSTGSDAPRLAPGGLVRQSGLNVHISPGAGAGVVFPWRFGVPAEITAIRLLPETALAGAEMKNKRIAQVKP